VTSFPDDASLAVQASARGRAIEDFRESAPRDGKTQLLARPIGQTEDPVHAPIFLDPSGGRHRRVRNMLVALLLLQVAFTVTAVTSLLWG
jgi:hypothetical protein